MISETSETLPNSTQRRHIPTYWLALFFPPFALYTAPTLTPPLFGHYDFHPAVACHPPDDRSVRRIWALQKEATGRSELLCPSSDEQSHEHTLKQTPIPLSKSSPTFSFIAFEATILAGSDTS
jgi:hypothetical protein